MSRFRLKSAALIAGGTALLGAAGIATAAGTVLWIQIVLGGLGVLQITAGGWAGLREQSRSRRAMMSRGEAAIRTHFEPSARGVTHAGERGDYFVGRDAALRELVGWLTADERIGALAIVTGAPGSGKSAVLGSARDAITREAPRFLGARGGTSSPKAQRCSSRAATHARRPRRFDRGGRRRRGVHARGAGRRDQSATIVCHLDRHSRRGLWQSDLGDSGQAACPPGGQ